MNSKKINFKQLLCLIFLILLCICVVCDFGKFICLIFSSCLLVMMFEIILDYYNPIVDKHSFKYQERKIQTLIYLEVICGVIAIMRNYNLYKVILYTLVAIVLTIASIYMCFYFKSRVHKPSKRELEEMYIKDTYVYHLTNKEYYNTIVVNDKINLKPTKSLLANVSVFFKPSVYFMVDVPTEDDIRYHNLKNKSNMLISIPIENLDKKKIRLRYIKGHTTVLIYTSEYIGKGKIKEFKI